MADNGFRSNRRDPLGRDGEPASQEGLSDPLAELARLIGQTDPHGSSRDSRPADPFDDPPASPEFDWAAADHGYAEQTHEADDGYAPPRPTDGYRQHPPDPASWPSEREYEEEAPPARQYFRPPPVLAEAHEDMRGPPPADVRARHEPPPLSGSRGQSGSYFPTAPEGHRGSERQSYGGQAPSYVEDYPHDEYEDEPAPSSARRSGTVVILAVIGLAVLGTAGALGYRAMFGGSVIPTLPPIIKPGQGPIKILPNRETQNGTPGAADTGGGGSGERVVERQEQPVDLPAGPPTPRVVTTIPVIANPQGAMPMGGDPAAAMPNSLPPGAQPNGMAPSGAVPGYRSPPDQMGAPPMPAPGSREAQTLPGRPDQGGSNAPGAAPPPAAARPVRTRDAAPKPRRPVAAGGPLSIVPGQDGDTVPEPQRTRTALARPSGATPVPLGGAPARETAIRGGEFSVQVSSQRSEGEAQAAFRSLQGRFPQQLGGRRAMIRRADLGAKGIYYRALVGPFASSEQAAELCSSLKAAGGSCLIQRN